MAKTDIKILVESGATKSDWRLVDCNFRAFIKRVLSHYDTVTYHVGIVGGFGWACRDMLEPLLEENGIRVAGFVNAPIEGLCKYHAIPR